MGKADIIGLGRSGIAAARLLKKQGWETNLSDRNSSPGLERTRQQLEGEGISVHLGNNYRLDPGGSPDLIVVSPGVPWDLPVLQQAREAGINTIGELELAWRSLNSSPWVGITGTNGKTTTTALIAAVFENAGLSAPACGNIGHAACELALTEINYDWIVAEISSYQCESSRDLTPKIGIWTTFTPDHLNRHKTLDNYYAIKAGLIARSTLQICNGDDPHLHQLGLKAWPDAYWTSVEGKDNLIGRTDKGIYLQDNWIVAFGELIAPINLFKMSGRHNWQNLLMAVGAARLAGIDKNAITATIASFPGVAHRLESICTKRGINFINDSKATNYDAAEVALKAFSGPVILIAGGEAKEGDDRGWITQIKNKCARVLLIGEAGPAFAARLEKEGYADHEVVDTMDKAVTRSLETALELGVRTVLLSPACASFDQYQSFEHRGDNFRELCKSL